MADPLTLSPDFLCALIRRGDLGHILRNGLLSVDKGGPEPLGAPDYLARRAATDLPPPYRGALTQYVPLRFTPLTPSSLSVLTGWAGAEKVAARELLFLVTKPDLIAALKLPFLFSDRGLVARNPRLFTDLFRLEIIDRERLASGLFDTRDDPSAPHVAEAEFLIWERLPPRAILEVVCSNDQDLVEIDSEITAVGRRAGITARADARFFFGRF